MNFSEEIIFAEKDALPKEWDFIIEPNLELEIIPSIQLSVKFEQQVKRLTFFPSTLSGEYSLIQLRRLIISSFALKKNVSFQIFCNQTNSVLSRDNHLLQAIKMNSSPLSLKVTLINEEEPCILCVSYDCCHSTTRSFASKDRKRREVDHDTLIPEFLEPTVRRDAPNKKRKLALSGSVPANPFSSSHAINSSLPKEIVINF